MNKDLTASKMQREESSFILMQLKARLIDMEARAIIPATRGLFHLKSYRERRKGMGFTIEGAYPLSQLSMLRIISCFFHFIAAGINIRI